MSIVNKKSSNPYDMTSDITSITFDVGIKSQFSIQAVVAAPDSGPAPTGLFELQSSHDQSNWDTITGKQAAVAGLGSHTWAGENCSQPYFRLKYTAYSGNGKLHIFNGYR